PFTHPSQRLRTLISRALATSSSRHSSSTTRTVPRPSGSRGAPAVALERAMRGGIAGTVPWKTWKTSCRAVRGLGQVCAIGRPGTEALTRPWRQCKTAPSERRRPNGAGHDPSAQERSVSGLRDAAAGRRGGGVVPGRRGPDLPLSLRAVGVEAFLRRHAQESRLSGRRVRARVDGSRPAGASAARLAELGHVYAAYEAELFRIDAVDRHGREWRVCEGLAAAEAAGTRPPTLAGVGKIVFAEIYDFSILQFLIATSLIRLVGDAELVAFAHPENIDATRFLERTWNRFVGDEAIVDQVLPSFVVRAGRSGSLAAALRGVFAAERPAPAPPDGSIRVVVAPSRYREVEAAGRAIRARLEQGAPPERMALLARDLGVYGDLIEDVCRRYRIPVYF